MIDPQIRAESIRKNVAWLSSAHPTPWKARQRPIGSQLRGKFPWEVVDANGFTVALCEYGQVGAILASAGNGAAEQAEQLAEAIEDQVAPCDGRVTP